jgi:archaellum component FlaC
MAILNTHAVVKKFTQHGFTEEHAELIVDAINDQSDQLATKNDLSLAVSDIRTQFRTELHELRTEFADLKSEVKSINTNINYYRLKPVVWSTLAKRIKSVNAKTPIF